MAKIFLLTEIQRKALPLLKSGAKHIPLFGGSRSGRTTVLVTAVIYRALQTEGCIPMNSLPFFSKQRKTARTVPEFYETGNINLPLSKNMTILSGESYLYNVRVNIAVKAGRKIAVPGKGSGFEPLGFTPGVVKLSGLERRNLYTIPAEQHPAF